MEATRFLPDYTYADYIQWEGKWELIEGVPFAMSPAPGPKHQMIAASISGEFYVALKTFKSCAVYEPLDYKIAENTILQPDMLLVCGPIIGSLLDRTPELIVEVLSPSTASKDRLYKLTAYQLEGVPYYIIVDADAESVELLELVDGLYKLAGSGHAFQHTFTFSNDCTVTIDVNEIWN